MAYNNKLMQIGRQFHKDFFEGGMEQAKQNLIKLNTMNTQENNKIIAEFMGITPNDEGVYRVSKHKGYDVENLSYHASWDWLMPVVEKIDLILPDDNLVTISFNRCLIEWFEKGITFEGLGNTRIEATYKAVVEFIKEHNDESNTTK